MGILLLNPNEIRAKHIIAHLVELGQYLLKPSTLANKIFRYITKYLGIPQMTPNEIKSVINVLTSYRNPRCLEWGSGYSTAFFSQYIGDGLWTAVEHNPSWHETVGSIIGNNVELILVPRKEYPLKEHKRMYIQTPLELSSEYDFVLVDGLYRNDCVEAAAQVLSQNGSIVLHDAYRPEYLPAMSIFETIIPHFNLREKHPGLVVLKNPQIN